jgi:membrane-associated phospholipid phosphatase
MTYFWPIETPVTLLLQNMGLWLKPIMSAFTFLGNELFFLVVMTGLYWCINSSLGIRVGFALLSTTTLNSWIKLAVKGARPYWFSDKVVAYSHEPSFGFPSGHSQSAVAVWGRIAYSVKKVWAWIVAIILILGIGISRIYLGVHFTTDVLSGWLIGIIFLIGFIMLEKPISKWWQNKKFSNQVIIAFFLSFILMAIEITLLAGVASWKFPEAWKTTAKINMIEQHQVIESELDREIVITGFEGTFSNGGIIFGMIVGISMLKKLGGFIVAKKWNHKFFSYLVGLAGVLVFYLGLKFIFPGSFSYGNLMLRYLRYSLIGLWISLVAPLIFIKLGWASKES